MAPRTWHKVVLKSLETQPSVVAQGTVGGLTTGVPGQDVVVRGILASMVSGDQQQTGVTPVAHPGAA